MSAKYENYQNHTYMIVSIIELISKDIPTVVLQWIDLIESPLPVHNDSISSQ